MPETTGQEDTTYGYDLPGYELDESYPFPQDDEASPLAAMLANMGTVSPEGQKRAMEIFNEMYAKRSEVDKEEQAAYGDYEKRAQEARETLQRARDVLAQRKAPSTKWLDMVEGFGQPTKTGRFGESLSNYAKLRKEGRVKEDEWESQQAKDLYGLDTGMANINTTLAMNKLKMRQLQQAANDKMMLEALKLAGKPTPWRAPQMTPEQRNQAILDRAYAPIYADFIQHASTGATDIQALQGANRKIKGTMLNEKGEEVPDPDAHWISGPGMGLFPKMMRDLIWPASGETQEAVESVGQKSLRAVLGPQFTAPEGTAFLARVFNPRFKEEVNARRVQRLFNQLDFAYKEQVRAARWYEEHHNSLAGFKGKYQWTLNDFDPDRGANPKTGEPIEAIQQQQNQVVPPQTTAPLQDPARGPEMPQPAGGPAPRQTVTVTPGHTRNVPLPNGKTLKNVPDNISDEEAVAWWQKSMQQHATGGLIGYQEGGDVDWGAISEPAGEPSAEEQIIAARKQQEQQDQPQPAPAPAPVPQQFPAPQKPVITGHRSDFMSENAAPMLGYGLAGMAATPALDLLQRSARWLDPKQRISGAQKRLFTTLGEQNLKPSQLADMVRQNQRMGVPSMAMDVGPPGVRALADSALGETGLPNAQAALAALKARQTEAGTRAMDQLNRGLAPDEYFGKLEDLKTHLYQDAKPLYDAAYAAHPGIRTKVFYKMLDTKDGRAAVRAARRIMQNEGKSIGKADIVNMVRKPSLEFLDKVKQGMDQIILQEEGSGASYKATPLGKSMRELRNRFRDELDQMTTDPKTGKNLYKEARAQYAGDLEVLDALQTGRDQYNKLRPKQLENMVANMSFAEKDALRTGVAEHFFAQLENVGGDINAARKVFGSDANQQKLRLLFDNDAQHRVFQAAMEREMDMYEASKSSIAAGEKGLAAHAAREPSLAQRVVAKMPVFGSSRPVVWALHALRSMPTKDEKAADELVKFLKSATPDELRNLERLDPNMARVSRRKGRLGKAAAAGAAAGIAGRALIGAFGDDDNAQ